MKMSKDISFLEVKVSQTDHVHMFMTEKSSLEDKVALLGEQQTLNNLMNYHQVKLLHFGEL